jgi:hypothetical protein
MPWLKARLREQGKTPTALAKALGVAAPRVYEMISGRRHIQPNEIEPMAKFLDWSMDEINRYLPKQSRLPDVFIAHAPNEALMSAVLLQVKQVRALVDTAPKPVDCDEVKEAVLTMILERFQGRPIAWDTIERGLALACFECKQAALSQAAA